MLNLPALAEHPAQQLRFPDTCSLEPDWRQPGQPLCPERFPAAELEQIRIRAGSYWWNALYQQRPSPAEGLLFQRHWLLQTPQREQPQRGQISQRGQQKPFSPLVLSCDLSFKGGERRTTTAAFVLLGLLAEQRGRSPCS